MIKIDSNTKKLLMDLYVTKRVGLEGNITKLIDSEDDDDDYFDENHSNEEDLVAGNNPNLNV